MLLRTYFILACAVGVNAAMRQNLIANDAAQRTSARDALMQVADAIDGAMKNLGHRHKRHKAAKIARSLVAQAGTPGFQQNLNDALSTAVGEIAEKIDKPIQEGHRDAQGAIDIAFQDFQRDAQAALSYKSDADVADNEYFACVQNEKSLLEAKEQADQRLQNAKDGAVAPCNLQTEKRVTRFEVNEAALQFGCDFADGNCDAWLGDYEAQLDNMLADLKSSTHLNVKVYSDAKQQCEAFTEAIEVGESDVSAAIEAWAAKKDVCARLYANREESICFFGSALQDKCLTELPEFQFLVNEVSASGTAKSHPDRVEEWTASHVTKCVMNAVMETGGLDDAQLKHCSDTASYNEQVGQINLYADEVADLLSPEKFSCADGQEISFKGDAWVVPDGEDPVSSDYTTTPFTAKLSLDAGSVPFDFCEGRCQLVFVGGSGANTMTTKLPYSDMHCSDDPYNRQDANWRDEFSVVVTGNSVSTTRIDQSGAGWGQKLEIKCCSTFEAPDTSGWAWQIVDVGNGEPRDEAGQKVVDLPRTGMVCDKVPQNPQNPRWNDRFQAVVTGKQLFVKRVDVHGSGWAQHLELKCRYEAVAQNVRVGSFHVDGSAVKVVDLAGRHLVRCSATPTNPQRPQWNDKFEVTVQGDKLRVQRSDCPDCGWGQDLHLQCFPEGIAPDPGFPCRPGEDIKGGTFQHMKESNRLTSSDQECNERCQKTSGCTAWVRPSGDPNGNARCWLTKGVPVVWEADGKRVAGVPGCVMP